jgi:hypothetical protein
MKISCGTKGARHELLVSADLMRQGFDVYRNLSPNGKTDLIAIKRSTILRVQVKGHGGGLVHIAKNEILALSTDGQISYRTLRPQLLPLIEGCTLLKRKPKCAYNFGKCENASRTGGPFCALHARRILGGGGSK